MRSSRISTTWMPKKTKRAKILAQMRRTTTFPARFVDTPPLAQSYTPEAPSSYSYSLSLSKPPSSTETTTHQSLPYLGHIKRDLVKTMIFAFFALLAEISIFVIRR